MLARARMRFVVFAITMGLFGLQTRPAQAAWLRWTLSASAGFGYEVHPTHRVQAENVMMTLGLGIVRDLIRFEAGAVSAYGALAGASPRHIHIELRPMVRFGLPLLPLYARLVFAGLNPFAAERSMAYGGALGLNIPLGPVALFGEAGTLPRRVAQQTHWIVEGRLGLSCRL